jgi:hypothetical protein
LGRYDVTMFQPTRPLVRWSRVLARRAQANGGSYVVENVMPKPRCLVTAAMAGTTEAGSLLGICRPSRIAVAADPRNVS